MDSKVGGSRKRKIWMVHQSENDDSVDTEEEDDEEVKIEKFFHLIQRIRESRERLLNQNGGVAEKEKKRKEVNNKGQVWQPRFQLEDFAQDHVAAASGKSADTTQTHALDLDLNLSL